MRSGERGAIARASIGHGLGHQSASKLVSGTSLMPKQWAHCFRSQHPGPPRRICHRPLVAPPRSTRPSASSVVVELTRHLRHALCLGEINASLERAWRTSTRQYPPQLQSSVTRHHHGIGSMPALELAHQSAWGQGVEVLKDSAVLARSPPRRSSLGCRSPENEPIRVREGR
jgi:hypothetical protein